MRFLDGSEIARFIRLRQSRQVAQLLRNDIHPKLAIIQTKQDKLTNIFTRLKQTYGQDIGVGVTLHKVGQSELPNLIGQLNVDTSVSGIVVQLPPPDPVNTQEILNLVAPAKDIDGLGQKTKFDQPTPVAILWLLASYNIELRDKNILVIGQGRLVGAPLKIMLDKSNVACKVADENTANLKSLALEADIIVSAAGQPGLLKADMVKFGAVVVDAGTAEQGGKIAGDIAPEIYARNDLIITAAHGGVGPLTICVLFENLLKAAAG